MTGGGSRPGKQFETLFAGSVHTQLAEASKTLTTFSARFRKCDKIDICSALLQLRPLKCQKPLM